MRRTALITSVVMVACAQLKPGDSTPADGGDASLLDAPATDAPCLPPSADLCPFVNRRVADIAADRAIMRPRVALGADGSLGFTWQDSSGPAGEMPDVALAVMNPAREVPMPVRLMRAQTPNRPAIVSTGSDFAVAWSETQVWRVFTSMTTTPETVTTNDALNPALMGDLAWNGSWFGIVFTSYQDGCSYVYGTPAPATGPGGMGEKLSTHDCMTAGRFDALDPAIAPRQDDDFAVVWADERGSGGLYFARLGDAGTDRAIDGTSLTMRPTLASNRAGRLGVTWVDGSTTTVKFMLLDDDGGSVTAPMEIGAPGAVTPSIAWSGRAWVVAWLDESFWVQVAWLGENGDPIYSTRVTEGDGSTEVSVAAAPEYAAIAWIGDRAKFLVDIVCAPCAAR